MTSASIQGPTRWVILDDTDSRIAYVKGPAGPGETWFAEQVAGKYQSDMGSPNGDTLHGSKPHQPSAYLSVNFTGTSFRMFGVDNARNDSGVPDVTVDCFLDTVKTSDYASRFPSTPEPNWTFCAEYFLPDTVHTVKVVPKTENQTFWFDQAQFVPSADAQLWNETIRVDNSDPAFVFGAGWDGIGMDYSYAGLRGSVLTYEFTGVSLSWYGVTPIDSSGNDPATFTYTLDDGAPQNVSIPLKPENATRRIENLKFFEIPDLQMGKHHLKVVYNGNPPCVPLVLDYVVIRNGTDPDLSSSPADTSPPSTTSPRTSARSGVIAGAVVGALVTVTVVLGLCFLFLRRWRRKEEEVTKATRVEPYHRGPSSRSFSTSKSLDSTSGNLFPLSTINHQSSIPYTQVGYSNDKAALEVMPETRPDDTSSPGTLSPGTSDATISSVIVRHQDSGLRPGLTSIMELPPEYSHR